jgi:cytidylate kinase
MEMSRIHQIIERQLRSWEMERGRRQEAEVEEPAPPPPTVTISREYGSGGRQVAALLADRLGYQLFDRDIVDVIAGNTDFRKATLESLDEGTLSTIHLWVESLLRGRYFDESDYHKHLLKVLLAIAGHGKAIILGRGANFVVEGGTVVKIRIVAPLDDRIRRVAEREGLAEDRARRRVLLMDEERAAFVRRHFGGDISDPAAYDAVLNGSALSPAVMADMIEGMVRFRSRSGGGA